MRTDSVQKAFAAKVNLVFDDKLAKRTKSFATALEENSWLTFLQLSMKSQPGLRSVLLAAFGSASE